MRRLLLGVVLVLAACSSKGVNTTGPTATTAGGLLDEVGVGERVTVPTQPAEPVEVGRWKNNTSTDTENFTVDGTWELHWNVTGQYGATAEWTEPGAGFPTDILQMPTGAGQSTIRKGGTYYLSIDAIGGSFEVWVVDVPN